MGRLSLQEARKFAMRVNYQDTCLKRKDNKDVLTKQSSVIPEEI